MKQKILRVALDTPLDTCFDYRCPADADPSVTVEPGQLALVPFGQRQVVGLVIAVERESMVPPERLKDALALRSQLPPLAPEWRDLCATTARGCR